MVGVDAEWQRWGGSRSLPGAGAIHRRKWLKPSVDEGPWKQDRRNVIHVVPAGREDWAENIQQCRLVVRRPAADKRWAGVGDAVRRPKSESSRLLHVSGGELVQKCHFWGRKKPVPPPSPAAWGTGKLCSWGQARPQLSRQMGGGFSLWGEDVWGFIFCSTEFQGCGRKGGCGEPGSKHQNTDKMGTRAGPRMAGGRGQCFVQAYTDGLPSRVQVGPWCEVAWASRWPRPRSWPLSRGPRLAFHPSQAKTDMLSTDHQLSFSLGSQLWTGFFWIVLCPSPTGILFTGVEWIYSHVNFFCTAEWLSYACVCVCSFPSCFIMEYWV